MCRSAQIGAQRFWCSNGLFVFSTAKFCRKCLAQSAGNSILGVKIFYETVPTFVPTFVPIFGLVYVSIFGPVYVFIFAPVYVFIFALMYEFMRLKCTCSMLAFPINRTALTFKASFYHTKYLKFSCLKQ